MAPRRVNEIKHKSPFPRPQESLLAALLSFPFQVKQGPVALFSERCATASNIPVQSGRPESDLSFSEFGGGPDSLLHRGSPWALAMIARCLRFDRGKSLPSPPIFP